TNRLYLEYKEMRLCLLEYLRSVNPGVSISLLISKAQKILDRILFICFCEDCQLLPAQTLERHSKAVPPGFSKWEVLQGLFRAIDKGYPPDSIPGYNGGLFAPDPNLDSLKLPDEACDLLTQLTRYNFDSEVSVTVLGHIFEQSISDLEAMHAAAHGEEVESTSRRKREGVYYTPPYITQFIVQETLGKYLEEQFRRIVDKHQPDQKRSKKKKRITWQRVYDEYRELLLRTRVLDPACGSGAFLVAAFDLLWTEYDRVNRALAELRSGMAEQAAFWDLNKTILNNNLYGVDLNEESVEITKLSLWIKTAKRGKPLTDLDHNIQCGNSLVDDPNVHPRAFDWQARFPEAFQDGGFDVIIGNPPYIKLQNFLQFHPREARWLIEHYRTCQTGNFDMYLPFIERSLNLLRAGGRMGFIAPSVWMKNDYGEGLRGLLAELRYMDRLVDFKSYQVFKDTTTYTALQFFTRQPVNEVAYAEAPDGDLMSLQWAGNSYRDLNERPWVLLPADEQDIMRHLSESGEPLSEVAYRIFVGVQTSADKVYHLERIDHDRFFSRARKAEVEIEEEIMRPLVSGEHVKRYVEPVTRTYILFPYDVTEGEDGNWHVRLWTQDEMENRFPHAWAYLRKVEKILREREHGIMDRDDGWWAFGRIQNLDKQHFPKLIIPRLLLHLEASMDLTGKFCLDNVDVGGVFVKPGWNPWYVLAVINSPVGDFFWRRRSKPFRGGYRSANRQFIAPLPIPRATTTQQNEVGALAEHLYELYTKRRAIQDTVLHRICTDFGPGRSSRRLEQWYELEFADLHKEIKAKFKHTIPVVERDEWEEYIRTPKERLAEIGESIGKLESEINQKVFSLYRLSDKDITIVLKDERITS
ncbi:DNA methyltransferase, partial [Syntrophothermus sp.]|uniref:Eco57I restriction-modification methylase domain-containing protein n=1 Tax=Syntrophothermus sp. TaxID=2736299 RepID=UPI00257CEAF9